jgi:exodeoxyribonuclease VII large subunit
LEKSKTIYSLAALNQSLERFIRDKFAMTNYWVVAEITKVQEKNGHYYLELADSQEGKRVAEMSANMWFTAFNRINANLNGELPAIFKQGNKILVNVRIEFHTIFGLKLNILDVDPTITYGEIEQLKKETIQRLKDEGLFERQRALYLEPIIKKIAIVGSPNTSGYRDFLNELLGNRIFTNFKVKEIPASVQGDYAIKEVVAGIAKANLYNVDAIIIVRGGGSKMDLNVFNSYEIAHAVATSKIPVITGIGHETDEVVADLVAHKREITPTAVAKFLYLRAGVFSSQLQTAFDAILRHAQGLVATRKEEFNHTSNYLIHFTQNLLRGENNSIKDLLHSLHIEVTELIEYEKSKLNLSLNRAGNFASNLIALKRSTELESRLEKIVMMSENKMDKERIAVDNLAELLNLLNPEALLKKGYTLSSIDGIDLNKYTGELQGAVLKTLTDKALITSEIKAIKNID